jgi:hypothetical protein
MRLFSSLPGPRHSPECAAQCIPEAASCIFANASSRVKVAFVQRFFARFSFSEHPI